MYINSVYSRKLATQVHEKHFMPYKILIIEDNPDIAKLIQLHLKDIHCEADIAMDGGEGVRRFNQGQYDLVILDLMLPVMDGLEVCRQLRASARYVPVIMLTSKSSELDRVLGLEIGADDYIIKPFSIPELMARVKAQFRHIEAMLKPATEPLPQRLRFGGTGNGLVIEFDKRRVCVNGAEVELTAKEFDLLSHFTRHPGRVYSRMALLDQVWGHSYEGYEHTVNSHINRLRAKIEQDPATPHYILTVWGVGYKFSGHET
jgi:DNA-binding response OmpR family regulator